MQARPQPAHVTAPSAAAWLDMLQASGRVAFSTHQAQAALGSSAEATQAALRRLKARGKLADPMRGFHVIVPPEYRALGCRPAEQFVPELMDHLEQPWHVGLLSAAALHGAAHQVPQYLQVVVALARRAIVCGGVQVDFVVRHDVAQTPKLQRNTATGVLSVATPEATAFELVAYPERCGYLSNVATVLRDLAERLDAALLRAEARRVPLAWVQRLGFLLELAEAAELAEPLHELVGPRALVVPLATWRPMTGAPRDARWRLALNEQVDVDQ